MSPKIRPSRTFLVLRLVMPILVLVLSLDIAYRRLIVGQVPTQFSSMFVYALLILNAVYVARELRDFRRTIFKLAPPIGPRNGRCHF